MWILFYFILLAAETEGCIRPYDIDLRLEILSKRYIYFYKVQRFGELRRRLDSITQSTLTKQPRELEEDGFLHREVYKEIPPKVEYALTALGESFIPVLQTMTDIPNEWHSVKRFGRSYHSFVAASFLYPFRFVIITFIKSPYTTIIVMWGLN